MGKEIKVVIGAVFGDEGKGLMTDYFCRSLHAKNKSPVLNVRYNGSSQAGHTVCDPDGRRHVFSHFGAGSFNPFVATYLTREFLLNPVRYVSEYNELRELGITPTIYANHLVELLLPYDALVNIFVEESRGKDRHGSCGIGVFEGVLRGKQDEEDYKGFEIYLADILFRDASHLRHLLKYVRDNYYVARFEALGVVLTQDQNDLFYSDALVDAFIEDIHTMLKTLQVEDERIFNDYQNIVFEGAQGLLLDWDNRAYMPHLTASYTGLKNVVSNLRYVDIVPHNLEICYISRSYFTRHGAGAFHTEVQDSPSLNPNINEKTNVTNMHQGAFRFGYFDDALLFEHINKDLVYASKLDPQGVCKKSVCITHLDETEGNILMQEKELPVSEFFTNIQSTQPITGLYTSYGETWLTVSELHAEGHHE